MDIASPAAPAERAPRGGFGRGANASGRGSHQTESRGRGARSAENGRRGRGRGQRGGTANDSIPHRHEPQNASKSETKQGTSNVGIQAQSTIDLTQADTTEEVEADVCFICASNVVHNSVAPCNHRTCHICALRLRALYKTKACAHCRTNADLVIFTDDPAKRFEDFTNDSFEKTDDNLGIQYEKNEIFEDTVLLLRYNCPEPSCEVACRGWSDLQRHVKGAHQRSMCDLCIRNKKVFAHEHSLFTHPQLRQHLKHGDDNPGAIDQSGFKGHPECGFCRIRYYGDDELYAHCRDAHERCHICERRRTGTETKPQYYLDYDALEVHFGKDHFLCADRECLEKKFVVFESEMDLKAHQLEAHPGGLSKDARRDARRVDMSGFPEYRGHAPEIRIERGRGGRSDRGRGRGRGRDPNANDSEPIPTSSAQPLRRDELAFQRSLAIHSAQSVTPRTFGGQLTSTTTPSGAQAARPQNSIPAPPTANTSNKSRDLGSESSQPSPDPSRPASPRTQARQLRHAAVTERASNLLGGSSNGLGIFRTNISNYKNNQIRATDLTEALFDLFDCSSSELGTLIREVAELFEVDGKREALLSAWNDWRAMNEGFPALSMSGIGASDSATGNGGSGKRILKLKSSTAPQNKRSQAGNAGTWNGVLAGTAASATPSRRNNKLAGDPFPSLGNTSSRTSTAAPWGPTASASKATPLASPAQSRPSSALPLAERRPPTDSFPALPAAQKPGMNLSRPGYAGNLYRKDGGSSTPVNAWSGGGVGNGPAVSSLNSEFGDDPGQGKKGKGKKKQTLMHWG